MASFQSREKQHLKKTVAIAVQLRQQDSDESYLQQAYQLVANQKSNLLKKQVLQTAAPEIDNCSY